MWHKVGFRRKRKYIWVLFLWIMFVCGCFAAIVLSVTLPFVRSQYIHRFVRAADRMLAAGLGYSGRQMLSTELAHSDRLKWMHDWLNEIQENHCEDSAFEEGAYCRLSDHKLGHK